ncbi:hypothetical protein EYF80_027876 [Liparis tanakae]|uniref:Uncharacterized protein n=1 Tax=Liparis tanakae TaxID=230148 RepID=A0A4Z2H8L2_9TELE|nr:hypothetical protein EYF80_027876 [Liparis tanakae]
MRSKNKRMGPRRKLERREEKGERTIGMEDEWSFLNARLTFRLLPLRLDVHHHYRCCRFPSRRPGFSPGWVSLRVALGPGLEDPRRQARSGVANSLQMFACIRA